MTERSDSSGSQPDAERLTAERLTADRFTADRFTADRFTADTAGAARSGSGPPAHVGVTLHRVIGIDLGTTTCAVAVWDGERVVVLPPVPAIVALDEAGRVIVGRSGADPETVIDGVKRRLGSAEKIRFRGRDYQPQEICAFILIELKRQAETLTGDPVHDAVITVPPTYGDRERRAITEAAGLAQLNVRHLLDEPAAAATAVGAPDTGGPATGDPATGDPESGDPESGDPATGDPATGDPATGVWAVYDLGGGTFDASVTEVGLGRVGVLAGGGDPRLGGDDFDERIVAYALRHIRERYHVDLSRDARIRARIRREAEIRKRELSIAETTTLELPALTATVDASVPLTRRAFEAMIEADLDRTFACLGSVFDDAEALFGVTLADLDGVLLVGASTRIPMIGERLARHFGLPPDRVRAAADPEGLVARGAGLVARQYPESVMFEGKPIGLRSAGLRLRSEMALPEPAGPVVDAGTGTPRPLPRPPAETPADFRPVAQASYELLISATGEPAALRAAYASFVAAIQSAAPDRRLRELGQALSRAWATDRGEEGTYP